MMTTGRQQDDSRTTTPSADRAFCCVPVRFLVRIESDVYKAATGRLLSITVTSALAMFALHSKPNLSQSALGGT